MVTLAHNLAAALQNMLEEAHRFGAPTVPHAQGPALIVKPFSWPQAQHLGASVALTHGSLSHIKCGECATRLLSPLLAQKLSIPRRGMELQGVQISEGIPEGLPVAELSTQAWPQRVDVSMVVSWRMSYMLRTLTTFQLARSPVKEVAYQNVLYKLVTLSTFHVLKSLLKREAPLNVLYKVVTLATFHVLKSLVKEEAPLNVPDKLSTLATFHVLKSLVKEEAP